MPTPTTATVIDIVLNPAGEFVAGTTVTLRGVGSLTAEAALLDPTMLQSLQGPVEERLTSAVWQRDLRPNAPNSPANNYYLLTKQVPGRPAVPAPFVVPVPTSTTTTGIVDMAALTTIPAATAGFDAATPSAPRLLSLGGRVFVYTGVNGPGTAFTGVTLISGTATGTIASGQTVKQAYWVGSILNDPPASLPTLLSVLLMSAAGAAFVGFAPTGSIAAGNVQAAIAEVASEAISADVALANALAGEVTRATTQEGLKLAKASNLSDVANPATALANLGGIGPIPSGTYVDPADASVASMTFLLGGDPTGVADSTAAWVDFLTRWDAAGGNAVALPGAYKVDPDSLVLPSAGRLFSRGVTLTSTGAGVVLGDTLPANQAAAETLIGSGRRLTIHGLRIEGDGTPGQTGLRAVCRAWLNLDQVEVVECDTNYDLIFCLHGEVAACGSTIAVAHGYRARSGDGLWTGATPSNSASNHTCFTRGTRDYASDGQLTQFFIEASDGVALRDTVTEGNNPINAIVNDAAGNTSVRTATVYNHHAENTPDNAHFKPSLVAGHIIVDQLWSGTTAVLIDGTDCGITAVIIARIPTISASPAFSTVPAGPRWLFDPSGNYGQQDFADPDLWVGGVVGTFGGLRFSNGTTEAEVNSPSLGMAGAEPWMHGTDVRLISDRTTFNVPGVHLSGATEMAVYDTGPVAGVFLANSRLCPSLDIINSLILFTAKASNGVVRFAAIPWVVQNLLGYLVTTKHAAPADGDLAAGDLALWFDQTNGSPKVMAKAKTADGTAVALALAAATVTLATKTADHVLALADPDVIEMNLAGANALTVPPDTDVAFPIGTIREVFQRGAGQTTITPGAGVTIRSNGGKLKLSGQYGSASLRKSGTDEWVAAGDLTT